MAEETLDELFNVTTQLYTSKIRELSNHLCAIRTSSLLDQRIKSSIESALTRLDGYIKEIREVKNESKDFLEKFELIRETEKKIRREEELLTLLEDVTDTFVSNRSLSSALSSLFEYLYHKITDENIPFLITSGGGDLKTFPYLIRENKIVVGTIGMTLYSASHIDEWVLAGHELGHILASKKFRIPIKYGKNREENFKMELLSDKIALRIFGPVFFEALAMKLTGIESEETIPEEVCKKYFFDTHPPESWRIWICYFQALSFDFEEAGTFIDSVESIINDIYPRPKDELFDNMLKELGDKDKYDMDEIRPIDDLKECYRKASELSSKWKDGYDTTDIKSYNPDEIVIAGYLRSRKDLGGFGLYTQQVISSLIRKQNYYLNSVSRRDYVASNIP